MRWGLIAATIFAFAMAGCVTTSMQGYADKELPSQPVSHVATLVLAPLPLAQAMQASLATEAAKRQIAVEDVLAIVPPTRRYTDAEIKRDLKDHGIDAVLVVNVGDTGVVQQYVGTVLSGSSSGSISGFGTVNTFGGMSTVSYNGITSTNSVATASPVYHYSRQTTFSAKFTETATGRTLWVGNGQVNAGGRLFVGDATGGSQAAAAIFQDLQSKGVVLPPG